MSAATRIATPYAKSLLDLARERGSIDAVTADMEHFAESVKNRDLHVMLKSPVITAEKKQKVMAALFPNYNEVSKAFLRIVVDKHREEALPEIATEYMRIYREERGITQVKITSATTLDEAALREIQDKLRTDGLIGDNVELTTEVDESLIGGFILEVGDRYYDASARHQLEVLRKEFTGNPYKNNIR